MVDLSLDVAEGEIFGLVGPDGAGKTTTMRLLTAIMDPTSGDAWVAGHHVVRQAEAIKEDIGYMSQRFGLYPDLTVMENLDFYADIYDVPRRGRREKIERLLAFSNLAPFRRRLAGNLSGGMKQKLGLACALIHTPKVLFLDEPTNGVDPVSRRDFWRILYQLLREKVTIFVSTAYLDEAERCNRLALIHRGRLLACGTPDEVKRLDAGHDPGGPRRRAPQGGGRPAARAGFRPARWACSATASTWSRDAAERDGRGGDGDPGRRRHAAGRASAPIEPSLEDVFVSVLATRKGREHGGRGAGSGARRSSGGAAGDPAGSLPELTTSEMPNSGEPAVVVDDLEKRFGSFVAVNRVSFEVDRGEIFGFLGPNGAGKSTTIRMLCGILAAHGRRRHRGRLRHPHAGRADQGQHRLHEPEVLALPGPDRRGEHRLLQRHLPHSGRARSGHGSSG